MQRLKREVAVDGLFGLPVKLQNPAAEGRLQERRDGISRKLLRRLIDRFLQRPHEAELFSFRLGLNVRVARVEKAAGEVRNRLSSCKLLQLLELSGTEPALKPCERIHSVATG